MARRPSLVELAVGAVATAGVVVAVTSVGSTTPVSSAREQMVTVKRGVVESTVSGTGNLSPASERELNFGASGTVTKVYVKAGQHVGTGQLLARIDDAAARVDLAEAQATLATAQDTLDAATTAAASSASTTASLPETGTAHTEFASATLPAATTTAPATTPATTTPAPTTTAAPTTTTTPATPTRTTTTPAASATTPRATTGGGTGTGTGSGSTSGSGPGSGSGGSGSSGSTTPATSKAAAQAAVASAELSVTKAEEALQETVLRAPYAGTVAAVGGQVGDTVTAGSGSGSSSSSSSSASSSGGGVAGGGSGASGGSGSSSSPAGFITLAQLSRYTMQVSLSESDIGKVKVGQRATVTVNAASGAEFAARVSDVAVLASSSSGSSAVSYPVTLRLTQSGSKLKAGMSASADIVVGQASGLIVPTAAIDGGSVTVARGGVRSTQRVETGVAGDTSTQVVAGLQAGDQVVVQSLAATAGAASRAGGNAASRFGGAGGLAGGGVGAALGGGVAVPGGFGGAGRFRGAP